MVLGTALTHVDSHGLAVLKVQGLAHRRDFGHFGHDRLVLDVKESAAARMQAVPCQFSTRPGNCSWAVVFTPTTLLTGMA